MAKCMIVDDSDAIRRVTKAIFRELSHDPIEAADGAQAMDTCRQSMPDVIIVDWHMPRMNGVEVIAALRAQPEGKRAKIIYCTTENDPIDIVKALAAGADDFMLKPFDTEELKAKFAVLQVA
jgi:two-component system chemotaxis response regulator CheY